MDGSGTTMSVPVPISSVISPAPYIPGAIGVIHNQPADRFRACIVQVHDIVCETDTKSGSVGDKGVSTVDAVRSALFIHRAVLESQGNSRAR